MQNKIEMRRRVGCLRPYLELEATGGDGSNSEPNTSQNEEKGGLLDYRSWSSNV